MWKNNMNDIGYLTITTIILMKNYPKFKLYEFGLCHIQCF